MHFLADYGLFLLKTATLVIAIIVVIGAVIALAAKSKIKDKESTKGKLTITKLNEKYEEMADTIHQEILNKSILKLLKKTKKTEAKKKQKSKQQEELPRLFVLNFHGDLKAQAVASLREEVTGLLLALKPQDKVLVRLESPGGMVNAYGLAASQLKRLRDANIQTIISVDKMAASGGYMMACVGHEIIAAPFAIIGSIGVVTQLPNFHRWLKKRNIDFEQITAGEYKRTLTVFGPNNSKDRQKVQEEVDDAHDLFKTFISQNRSQVDISNVSTGEHWFGIKALELQLVDKLQTSDDFLLAAKDQYDIYEVQYKFKQPLGKRIVMGMQTLYENVINT